MTQDPRAKVWRALTDAAEFGRWLGAAMKDTFAPGARAQGRITYPGYEHLMLGITPKVVEFGSTASRLRLDDMTIHDHTQVMSKVGIADLKAHLSQHLRKVRSGRTITVLDRDTPVAQIVPYDAETPLEVRRATRKPRDLRLPPPTTPPTNSLLVLLKDRASR